MNKLLLVEDDAAIARNLADYLQGEGFAVQTASGQRQAEALLAPGAFELALVDLSLADGSGFGVCAAAKRLGLPVIFVTASGDEGSVVAGLDMGADDYVAKPFRPRELVSRVRPYCFKRFSFCWGARALVVFSVYSAIFSWAVALMSRLEEPMRKV